MEKMQIKLREQKTCPVCGSTVCYPVLDTHYKGQRMIYKHCYECWTRFSVAVIDNEADYYKNIYRKLVHGTEIPPDHEIKYQEGRAQHIVNWALPYIYRSADANVLDFGSSLGLLLKEVETQAPQGSHLNYFGVELDTNYMEHGLSHNLYPGSVLLAPSLEDFEESSFDVVFLMHVLEHSTTPNVLLKSIWDRMSDRGKLILEVPNRNYNRFAYILHHPLAFDFIALRNILQQGFKLEDSIVHSSPNGDERFPLYLSVVAERRIRWIERKCT